MRKDGESEIITSLRPRDTSLIRLAEGDFSVDKEMFEEENGQS